MRLFDRFLGRRETRAADATAAIIAALTDRAAGKSSLPGFTAAEEHAAGLWSRALASARPSPLTAATAALTPSVLGAIGRGLIRRGETLHEIVVESGRLYLRQASTWTVTGSFPNWVYEADFPEPTRSETRRLESERVVHCMFAVDPSEPWRGISPFSSARYTRSLAGNLERQLGNEAAGPAGNLIPAPENADVSELQRDINRLTGQVSFAPSFAGGLGSGSATAPAGDYALRRLGLNAPQSTPLLRQQVMAALSMAAGIPASLAGSSDAQGAREGFRQFLHGSVTPVAKMVASEIDTKLDAPEFKFDFSDIRTADIVSMARGVGSLATAGVDVDDALEIVGLA